MFGFRCYPLIKGIILKANHNFVQYISAMPQFQPKFELQITNGDCLIVKDNALILPPFSTLLGLRYGWRSFRVDSDNQIWVDRSKDALVEFDPKYANFSVSAKYRFWKKWTTGIEHNCIHVIQSANKPREMFGGEKTAFYLKYGY